MGSRGLRGRRVPRYAPPVSRLLSDRWSHPGRAPGLRALDIGPRRAVLGDHQLPTRPDTVGGYVQWRAFGFFAIVFAIWGLAAASGAVRGDEERGIVQALLASGLSRPRMIAARFAAFASAAIVAALAASA